MEKNLKIINIYGFSRASFCWIET